MLNEGPQDLSLLLGAWNAGDENALPELMSRVYPRIRQIARQHLGRQPAGHTLESAALANEAYLKLLGSGGIRRDGRLHFLSLCSQIIRRLLVDHARRRGFAKRGGNALRITLDEGVLVAVSRGIDVLALEQALESLSRLDARKCRVVELRYFGGLTVEETAEVLGISEETTKRDWKMAKAWLFGELASAPDHLEPQGVK